MDLNSILPFLNGMNKDSPTGNANAGANSQAANILNMMNQGGPNMQNPNILNMMNQGGANAQNPNILNMMNQGGANPQAANLLSMMQQGGINRDELVKNMFPQMNSGPMAPLMNMLMQQNATKKTGSYPAGLSVISNFVPSEILGRLVKYFKL